MKQHSRVAFSGGADEAMSVAGGSMSKAETVRTGRVGKTDLRLMRKDGRLFRLADGTEGENADEVWQRLSRGSRQGKPQVLRFRWCARFRRRFPNGFNFGGLNAEARL
jgi:hypothetical protein